MTVKYEVNNFWLWTRAAKLDFADDVCDSFAYSSILSYIWRVQFFKVKFYSWLRNAFMFCFKFCLKRIATILLQSWQNPIGMNSDSLRVTSFFCSWWPCSCSHVQPNVIFLLSSEWWNLNQNQAFKYIHNLMAFLSGDIFVLQLTLWDRSFRKLPHTVKWHQSSLAVWNAHLIFKPPQTNSSK